VKRKRYPVKFNLFWTPVFTGVTGFWTFYEAVNDNIPILKIKLHGKTSFNKKGFIAGKMCDIWFFACYAKSLIHVAENKWLNL
jgi:hypothetical protein